MIEQIKSWFTQHHGLTVVLAFLLGGVGGWAGHAQVSSIMENVKAENLALHQEHKIPMMVIAEQIEDDFDSNQDSKKKEWYGQYIQFTSRVSNVVDGNIVFTEATDNDGSLTQIRCEVSQKGSLGSLKPGILISVKGTIGKQSGHIVKMQDCSLVK